MNKWGVLNEEAAGLVEGPPDRAACAVQGVGCTRRTHKHRGVNGPATLLCVWCAGHVAWDLTHELWGPALCDVDATQVEVADGQRDRLLHKVGEGQIRFAVAVVAGHCHVADIAALGAVAVARTNKDVKHTAGATTVQDPVLPPCVGKQAEGDKTHTTGSRRGWWIETCLWSWCASATSKACTPAPQTTLAAGQGSSHTTERARHVPQLLLPQIPRFLKQVALLYDPLPSA